jgi:hypothetical protein
MPRDEIWSPEEKDLPSLWFRANMLHNLKVMPQKMWYRYKDAWRANCLKTAEQYKLSAMNDDLNPYEFYGIEVISKCRLCKKTEVDCNGHDDAVYQSWHDYVYESWPCYLDNPFKIFKWDKHTKDYYIDSDSDDSDSEDTYSIDSEDCNDRGPRLRAGTVRCETPTQTPTQTPRTEFGFEFILNNEKCTTIYSPENQSVIRKAWVEGRNYVLLVHEIQKGPKKGTNVAHLVRFDVRQVETQTGIIHNLIMPV